MAHLNENERVALDVIVATCDEIGDDLFTRMRDAVEAVIEAFGGYNEKNIGQVAGGYINSLMDKGFLELEEPDPMLGQGVWVNVWRLG